MKTERERERERERGREGWREGREIERLTKKGYKTQVAISQNMKSK